MRPPKSRSRFTRLAKWTSRVSGRPVTFILAVVVILLWLISGPLFGFSDTWQLVINTGTTIVTFLMVFLIQRAQNNDSLAVHLKLNEIVAALEGASSRLINVEDLSEEEVILLHKHYRKLAELAKHGGDLRESYSIEEAERRYRARHQAHKLAQHQQAAREAPKDEP